MRKKKITLATVVLLMLFASLGVHSFGQANAAASASVQLSSTMKAEVRGVLDERVADGTRIGAVIRLYNSSSKLVKVPDYELRAKTTSGVGYALKPSSANKTTIQPKEYVDLSYMTVISRKDAIKLYKLSWIKVNTYVYPKKETLIKELVISGLVWGDDSTGFSGQGLKVAWGTHFQIPSLDSSLEYVPTRAYARNTPDGSITLLTLLVTNKGQWKEEVPEFVISGVASGKVYQGLRIGEKEVVLEPGERQTIYYAIPTNSGVQLESFNVLTPVVFVDTSGKSNTFAIGRLNIQLPQSVAMRNPADVYSYDTPIRFDSGNGRIQDGVDISLEDLQLYEGEGSGYKVAVAKFKIFNRENLSVPLPDFAVEMVNKDGVSYDGVRQADLSPSLNPNLGTVVSYFFVVPEWENGDGLTLNLLDGSSAAPYMIPIAGIATQAEQSTESTLAFYPYQVNLSKLTSMMTASGMNNELSVTLNVEVGAEEQVMATQGSSSLKLELYSQSEGVIDTVYLHFTGADRLISGKRTVKFNLSTSTFGYGSMSLRAYESFDTPAGEANRLVQTIPL